MVLDQPLGELLPGDPRHHEVGEQEVDRQLACRRQLECLFAIGCDQHLVPRIAEHFAEQLPDDRLVLHQ
jgi:hypothetical protein